MDPQGLLAPYWLRAVRIGIVATLLIIPALVAFPFLPGREDISRGPYLAILATATAGGGIIAALPWPRLLDSRVGVRFLYAWSLGDITLISLAIATTGGGRSDLFALYALTVVFAAAYPLRVQLTSGAYTVAAYLVAVAAVGWEVSPRILAVRLAVLAVLGIMAGLLSGELRRRVLAHAEALRSSERWAALLTAVATAAHRMTLDPGRISGAALDAVQEMELERAGLYALDEDAPTYRAIEVRGLQPDVGASMPLAVGITGLVLRQGSGVVLGTSSPEGPPTPESGCHAMVASPVWVGGWLAAVLVGGSAHRRSLDPHEVQAFELLASQTGLALENARRYEEQRRTAEQFEELDRLKSDFLATASHELRTPITAIQGIAAMVEGSWSTLGDGERAEMLGRLADRARSLDGIITSMLDFSRLEAHSLSNAEEAVDVSALLGRAVERMAPLLARHRFRWAIDPGLIVQGDGRLIGRVVDMLLSNAAKHTPEGTCVSLSATGEGAHVLVVVEDDGPGIRAQDLDLLGERFFRGGEINDRPEGLGLGLALAREIVDLLGGDLGVESEPSRGARFTVRLHRVSSGDGSDRDLACEVP